METREDNDSFFLSRWASERSSLSKSYKVRSERVGLGASINYLTNMYQAEIMGWVKRKKT